jgi:serine/threonine-protein kinase
MRETDPSEASTQIDEFRSTDEQYARKPDPRVGLILDSKYKLVESLGEGGMGSVFRAQRLHIGDEVAVKLLHHDLVREKKALERFRREARTAAMIRHPNVVSIHDFNDGSSEATQPYIVMELVRGVSLGDLIRREGRMTPQRAVRLMNGVCTGVGVAHRQGLLHRDLKPDNVIVVPPSHEGDEETAKVVDFGLAKVRDVAATALTHTGAIIGTLYYMSPEQCSGEEVDARADVYSLGAMFYEMLTGGPPFRSRNLAGLIAKHLNEPPAPFPESLGIPKALESVCLRALAKDRNQRPPDAIVFGRELQNALTAPAVSYQPASFVVPARRSPLKWLIAAFGLFFALIVIIVGGFAIKFGVAQFRSPPSASPPSKSPPVTTPSQSVAPVASDVDLRGTWTGTYGHMGVAAKLIIKNHNGDKLDGTLEQGPVRVAFSGTYDAESKSLKLKQTEVLNGEGWSLGEDSGTVSDGGRKISGTGKDEMGGPLGFVYQWSFSKR